MNELQVFNFNQHQVRTVMLNDKPYWVLKDVCDVLGLSNPTVVASRLEEDERTKFNLGRQGETTVITESGLYAVILRSDKPNAKQFRKWVTGEVLPEIRRTGGYKLPTHAEALRLYANALEENEKLQLENKELKPKAEFFDTVANSKTAVPMENVAKVIGIKGLGRNNLFEFLRRKGILQQNNIPYQKYVDCGYFRVVEQHYSKPNGERHISFKTLVYQKGINYIVQILKREEMN